MRKIISVAAASARVVAYAVALATVGGVAWAAFSGQGPFNAFITDPGGVNQAAVKSASTGAATTDQALVVTQSPNASGACPSTIAINQTASTDLHTFTAKGHICSIVIVSATQQGISLIEGTGANCATGTANLMGGSSGTMQVAANGGFSAVSQRHWLNMVNSADHLCLIQSGSGNVSGTITYLDQ